MGGTIYETESERLQREVREELEPIIAEKDRQLAESKEALAEKDRTIAELRRQLADK